MPAPPDLSPEIFREIAHELRSPLGGFEAMLELLAATELSPEQAQLASAMAASAAHLRAILGRILPAHAGESPSMPDLGGLIGTIAASAGARAARKGLDFALHRDPALDEAEEIDAIGLRQVLENLIDNAIRLTRAGGIALFVSPGAPGRIAFRLRDSGPGLDTERARALLAGEPVAGERRRGLGLAIAARLVAEAGGRLRAEPAGPEGGTVFHFDWPLKAGPGLARASAEGAGRVLIVDDHPASRLILRRILAALGFACAEAADPDGALAMLRADAFAAIFTDLEMPGGGGRALMKALSATPRPALIVVSADDPREDETLAGLFDAAVGKPLRVADLVSVIGRLDLAPAARRVA